jgi:hypothetical protein
MPAHLSRGTPRQQRRICVPSPLWFCTCRECNEQVYYNAQTNQPPKLQCNVPHVLPNGYSVAVIHGSVKLHCSRVTPLSERAFGMGIDKMMAARKRKIHCTRLGSQWPLAHIRETGNSIGLTKKLHQAKEYHHCCSWYTKHKFHPTNLYICLLTLNKISCCQQTRFHCRFHCRFRCCFQCCFH